MEFPSVDPHVDVLMQHVSKSISLSIEQSLLVHVNPTELGLYFQPDPFPNDSPPLLQSISVTTLFRLNILPHVACFSTSQITLLLTVLHSLVPS